MFRFESPIYLYFLIIIPLLILLYLYNKKKTRKNLEKLGKWQYVKELILNFSSQRLTLKFVLLISALALIILAMARPQLGTRLKTDQLSGIEVVVALDVSNSMMAQDVDPTRLDKAKHVVSSLCNRLHNDKIALVVFAGNAFLQVPISADNVSISMFLDGINTGMIPTQGTAIAEALSVSLNSFSKQKGVKRAIVVITDGEDHQGGVDDVVKELKNNNISVYVLGIGDPKGSPIKIGNDYLRDINGQTVISRLNEQMCKDIANKTNGTYIHVDNSNSAQEQLLDELNHIQRSNLETATYEDYNELFPWLIMIAMILICVEVLIQYHGNNIISRLKAVKHSDNILRLVIFVLVTSLSTVAMGQLQSKVLTHKGNVAFNAKHDSMAIINYKKALAIDKDNYKAHFNLGNTFLRQGKGQEAMAEYEKGAKASPSRLVKKAIYHNMGYIYYIAGKYDKAVDAFKQALLAEPKDDRTRYDLAMAQYMLKKNPKQSGGSNSKQKDKGNQNQENKSKNNNSNSDSKQQSEENISKQNTEQMLRAVQMKEKQTQEKLKHKHRQNSRQYIEKNW